MGATNQLATIMPNLPQAISAEPTVASPDPISAPTTVCVPEIGMPKMEDAIIKMKELIEVPSIIYSTNVSSRVSTVSMTLPTSAPAT